jgi:hypothetical protein
MPIIVLAVLVGGVSFSCKTMPDKPPAIDPAALIGTEWNRVNPPVEPYTLVFTDKSNCIYAYPKVNHERTYTVKGNTIKVANDIYEMEGDTLYYKSEIYFVKIKKE